MRLFLKFDFPTICRLLLEKKLDEHDLKYKIANFGELELLGKVSTSKIDSLKNELETMGISIIENQKTALVQKIKDTIVEMISSEDTPNIKTSVYLAEKLEHSYGYLSNLFSEVTYTSIEHFTMLQKIEYAKHLIINDKLSLTEISYKLNYSSVAHLSTQFKNITGITPTQFQRIIQKRRDNAIKKVK